MESEKYYNFLITILHLFNLIYVAPSHRVEGTPPEADTK